MFASLLVAATLHREVSVPLPVRAHEFLTRNQDMPSEAETAKWIGSPMGRLTLTTVARDTGLLGDEWAPWEGDLTRWPGNTPLCSAGCVWIIRNRAWGTPLPRPIDPSGPKEKE